MTATTITWQSLDQIFFNEKWGEVQLINDPVKDCRVTVRKRKSKENLVFIRLVCIRQQRVTVDCSCKLFCRLLRLLPRGSSRGSPRGSSRDRDDNLPLNLGLQVL